MSSTLSVKIKHDIGINELLTNAESVLKELLSVSEVPKLIPYGLQNGIRKSFEGQIIGQDKQYLLIGLDGIEDGVSVTITEVQLQLPYVTEDEAGNWAMVTVGVKKSPIEFSLAASIAIALANTQGSDITDDGCIWNKVFKQKPDEFMQAVCVNSKFSDTNEAAKAMVDKLNFVNKI